MKKIMLGINETNYYHTNMRVVYGQAGYLGSHTPQWIETEEATLQLIKDNIKLFPCAYEKEIFIVEQIPDAELTDTFGKLLEFAKEKDREATEAKEKRQKRNAQREEKEKARQQRIREQKRKESKQQKLEKLKQLQQELGQEGGN